MNFEAFLSNTETREHSHPWGQVQLISGGILEMEAEDTRFWLRLIWRFGFQLGFAIEATTASPSNTVH